MFTEIDTRCGLVKTTWDQARSRVKSVCPEFVKLVDQLSPDFKYPIYLAYFPYGELKGDTVSSFIPLPDGGVYRLNENEAPKDILKHLGYGIGGSPFGMILEKNFEYYIDLKHRSLIKPWFIGKPGTFFPIGRLFRNRKIKSYSPNGILCASSGARSAFMLPSISRELNHSYLQRDFNITSDSPCSFYDQWHIFKELANSPHSNCEWKSCLLYFSEKWLKKILNDKEWAPVKTYLYETAWDNCEFDRTYRYYNVVFSEIQSKRNLKLNPYLADTARHILNIALGDSVGYSPQINDDNLPIEAIQSAYIESYNLKNQWPTIMAPSNFDFEKSKYPSYYSLQLPSAIDALPKSSQSANTLSDIRELKRILNIYIDEITSIDSMCDDTILSKAVKNINISCYHNKNDRHRAVIQSNQLLTEDKRFKMLNKKYKLGSAVFASDASFLRGCVGIDRSR